MCPNYPVTLELEVWGRKLATAGQLSQSENCCRRLCNIGTFFAPAGRMTVVTAFMKNPNLSWVKNRLIVGFRLLWVVLLVQTGLPGWAQIITPPCPPGCVSLTAQRVTIVLPVPSAPPVGRPAPAPPVEVPTPEPPTSLPIEPPVIAPQPEGEAFAYQVPTVPTAWGGHNPTILNGQPVGPVSAQESDELRLEVRKDYGGSIQIYDKITKQNLINFLDLGRETGMSTYTGPDSFSDDAPNWKTGYNPLQAGDSGGNPSTLLFHGLVDNWIYTKYQCNSWSHVDNRILAFFYEQWVRLDGNKVRVKVRLTHQRADKTFYRPYQQEWPMMMINGTRIVRFYAGSAPFTKSPVTTSNGIERQNGGAYVTHQLTPFQITEPWMATEVGANRDGGIRLIGLTGPEFLRVSYNMHAVQGGDNTEGGNTITYWAHHPIVHIDSDGVWLKEYTYVVGSEEQIRDYAYAQARSVRPDFVFNKERGRNDWVIIDGGHDQKEPFQRDNWTVTYDGKADPGQPVSARGTKLVSPMGSWRAADAKTIYIKMRYKGQEDHLNVAWLLNGQAPDGVDSNYPNQNSTRFPRGVRDMGAQLMSFKLINDGQMHTYKLDMGWHAEYKDVIQQFEVSHDAHGPVIDPGEEVELVYFGVNNPD